MWGFGVTSDIRLFEKICLEGFQSGLSWLTILRKRENFRAAFAGFDPEAVAAFDDVDVVRLLADAGIVRHQGKIRSTINNAHRALELSHEFGSLAAYFWPHAEFGAPPTAIQAGGETWADKPIGAGPFTVQTNTPDSEVEGDLNMALGPDGFWTGDGAESAASFSCLQTVGGSLTVRESTWI